MNSFPKPQSQNKDTSTFNPESKNQSYSPDNHCIMLQKDKVRSVYQQLNKRHQQTQHLNTQDLERKKSYSCAHHNSKYNQDKQEMQARKDKDKSVDNHSFSRRKRRQKICRSAQNRQISIPPEQQEKLFHRITIHCLKAKRQAVEYSSKEVLSQYSFVLKKIANLKRSRQIEQFKQKKISLIKQENRKMSEELHKNHLCAESRKRQEKQELRNHVIAHRSCRKQIVLKKLQDNLHSASEQRLFSKQIHDRIHENFRQSYQQKRQQCQKERKQNQKRQLMKSKKLQAKKMQARKQFRNRWLRELQMAEQAEKELVKKQADVKQKISEAIESYNQLLGKH